MLRVPRNGIVYFVESGRDGPIKIGVAGRNSQSLNWVLVERSLQIRVKDLQVANPIPIHILATTFGGGFELEQYLHHRFSSGNIQGEWFHRSTPGLVDYITRLLDRKCARCENASIQPYQFLCDECYETLESVRIFRNEQNRIRRKHYVGRPAEVPVRLLWPLNSPFRQ